MVGGGTALDENTETTTYEIVKYPSQERHKPSSRSSSRANDAGVTGFGSREVSPVPHNMSINLGNPTELTPPKTDKRIKDDRMSASSAGSSLSVKQLMQLAKAQNDILASTKHLHQEKQKQLDLLEQIAARSSCSTHTRRGVMKEIDALTQDATSSFHPSPHHEKVVKWQQLYQSQDNVANVGVHMTKNEQNNDNRYFHSEQHFHRHGFTTEEADAGGLQIGHALNVTRQATMREAEIRHHQVTQSIKAEAVDAVNVSRAQAVETVAQARAEVGAIRHSAQEAVDHAKLSHSQAVSELEEVKRIANAVHAENQNQQEHIAGLSKDIDNARIVIAEGIEREAKLAATAQERLGALAEENRLLKEGSCTLP